MGGIPNNTFIYGQSGTGKTLVAQTIAYKLQEAFQINYPEFPHALRVLEANCRYENTGYRVVARLCREVGINSIPATGLQTEAVMDKFFKAIDTPVLVNGLPIERKRNYIIILDEINAIVGQRNLQILYLLTRANEQLKYARISIIGICNDLRFRNGMEEAIRSTLRKEEIYFPPYTSDQLNDILQSRADLAFYDGVVNENVVPLCAAMASSHGDARLALDLIRTAGETAERMNSKTVEVSHVHEANGRIELDLMNESILSMPLNSKIVIFCTYLLEKYGVPGTKIRTRDLYLYFTKISSMLSVGKVITKRRVMDLISGLEIQGFLSGKTESFGRHGRSKLVYMVIERERLEKCMEKDGDFKNIKSVCGTLKQELIDRQLATRLDLYQS
jgi:cell division control protein 6